jgi:uncharacterized protein YhbP (UPF0306 family)
MADDLIQGIEAFLDAYHVVSLATVGPAGPHACNLFYARDGLALVWMSDPDTRHSREIEAGSRVAATVAPDYADFATIKGVQIAGEAQRVADPGECQRLLALLEARYPFLGQLAAAPPKLREAYARTAVYRLEPSRMVLIDNSKRFGHKETLDLSK